MKPWNVQYWLETTTKNSIEYWMNKLTHEQLKSVKKEIELLKLYGNSLKMPHSKPLGKGIFELRERRNGFRIYYCFQQDQIIVLLIAGDKASQKNDILIARQRFIHLSKNKL